MTKKMRNSSERGMAMITTLFVMMLMSALLVGFTAVVMSDQRYRFIDRDRNQAFYAASAGIEKLTSDLGNLFLGNVAPTPAQLNTVTASKPAIDGVSFVAPLAAGTLPSSSLTRCVSPNTIQSSGSDGYTLRYCAASTGQPTTTVNAPIKTGPYEGLIALQMPFQMDVSAKTVAGGEVHLVRSMEAVAIPVFQFGIFSDVDLSFSAADDFDFGGRVHTNKTLFLANTSGKTLTLRDKVTAVEEVIRQRLSNGVTIGAVGQTGTVRMATSPSAFRNLAASEGSLVDGPNSSFNEPTWHTISLSSYNSWIRNRRTGARALNLPVITVGGTNPDIVKRPLVNEDANNPLLFQERMFGKASLRILLSDTAADITNLPSVTSTAPVSLDGNWRATSPNNGLGSYIVDASHPPVARSPGPITAVISTGATAGTGKTLTVGAGVPGYFRVPDTLVVTAGAYTRTLTGCSTTKTATTFTCTAVAPAHTAGKAAGALVSANVTRPDGTVVAVSTLTTASWNAGALTLTVQSTMAFAEESFWVNGNLVSCGGYTATTFTNCTLPINISNNSTLTNSFRSSQGTGTIGGFIKIERGNTDGTWTDVTMQILNHGVAGRNLGGALCPDPTPNAIIRLQRIRDNNWASCPHGAAAVDPNPVSSDFWPNTIFDTREAVNRDLAPADATKPLLGGVMHYVTIDVENLSKYFTAQSVYAGQGGDTAKKDNEGFTVYFSDRRNNRNSSNQETGDYGFEDYVNPGTSGGPSNGTLDAGEDVNANSTLDVYGGIPNYNGTYGTVPPGATAPLNAAARPNTAITRGEAQVNRAILFRRGLKLTRGANINQWGVTGLTIVSENPVYIHGDWNAQGGGWSGDTAATAVIADAVGVLSNSWNDNNSFASPYDVAGRPRAAQSWYRVAIISGKGPIFPKPSDVAAGSTFGTDGGAHSFLRMLEGGAGTTVNYRGSMATFYYNRQANGPFKCCGDVVYDPPIRAYTFDTNFLTPALLPPNTPMFRDLNAVGFAQEMRPGR